MADRDQGTCVLPFSFATANPRDGRSAAQSWTLHGPFFNHHIVKRQTSMRMCFHGSLLRRKSKTGR
ncbi:unnamed protein product [Fusarium graminearum]|nr:unnamed protein product [Fusarium graminearum]